MSISPSQTLYQGNPNIHALLSMSMDTLLSLQVVNTETEEVLGAWNTKQLLGKDYRLLNKWKKEKQKLAHLRHKAQRRGARANYRESGLAKNIERLLAKSVCEKAQQFKVGVIVLPNFGDIREDIESKIQAKAEEAIPGFKRGQKAYAKQLRMNVHRWAYRRLATTIESQVAKLGIQVDKQVSSS